MWAHGRGLRRSGCVPSLPLRVCFLTPEGLGLSEVAARLCQHHGQQLALHCGRAGSGFQAASRWLTRR